MFRSFWPTSVVLSLITVGACKTSSHPTDRPLDIRAVTSDPRGGMADAALTVMRDSAVDAHQSESRASTCPAGTVPIAAAAFTMGDSSVRHAAPHPVTVRPFCLDATEVTVESYNQCVTAGACESAGESVDWAGISPRSVELFSSFCNGAHRDRLQHPINCVSWTQANAYCTWAHRRLLSEAEWEAAARYARAEQHGFRAGDGNVCDIDCSDAMQRLGLAVAPLFTSSDGWAGTAPVGSFRRSGGIADLFGNVREWVADWYAPYSRSRESISDPRGPEIARMRVTRGGHWQSVLAREMEPYARSFSFPNDQVHDLGFRCAADLPGATPSPAGSVLSPPALAPTPPPAREDDGFEDTPAGRCHRRCSTTACNDSCTERCGRGSFRGLDSCIQRCVNRCIECNWRCGRLER